MSDYETEALFCLSIVVIFTFLINVTEIYAVFQEIKRSMLIMHDPSFDCAFNPLISRLTLIICTTLISFICLLSSAFLLCFNAHRVLEQFILYSLFVIFGPIMTLVCFFFILNYEQYGYTCDSHLNKIYNPVVWVILNFLCFVGIILTITTYAKALIKRIECLGRSHWAKRTVACLLCEMEELHVLEQNDIEEQRRAQL